jgi:sugar lactone lactonase YvrE
MKLIDSFIIIFLLVFPSEICFSQTNTITSEWELVFSGLDFPEGPALDSWNNLFLSNCYGSWIARFSGDKVDTFLIKSDTYPSIQNTNGLLIINDYIYACDYGLGAILRISMRGEIEVIAESFNGERFNRPNDIISDANGNIFFTDPKSYGRDINDGRVFKLDIETFEIDLIAENLAFPNGINISPIDNKLYLCESAKESIVRFDLNEEGILTNKELFIELPGGDPDGIEFDREGNLYAAHFGGGAVYVISVDGKIIKRIETPGKKPTNLEFLDSDKKILYLTEVETNSVYKINLNNNKNDKK